MMVRSHAATQRNLKAASVPDALQSLADLRAVLVSNDTGTDALGRFSEAIDQIMIEHGEMTEELLGVYEQLGIVFELTRKLAAAQSEKEAIQLFLSTLQRSFHGRTVTVARPRPDGGWSVGAELGPSAWFDEMLRRAGVQKTVFVERPASGDESPDVAEAMFAAVRSGEDVVCVVIVLHADSAPAFRASEMSLIEALTRFCGDLIRNQRLVRELRGMSIAMVRSLVNAVDQKDEYTCNHSLRVAYYSTSLAKALGFRDVDLQMLQWAALLHDVGKIGIRDSVLKKEGKLTDEEFEHIKEHPVRSHRVVQEVPQLAAALDGILHHHERFDGSGYPEGLKGEEIPLQARIIQIADVFDALTSNRSYRPAYDVWQALKIMKDESGRTIDPRLAETFDGLVRETLGDDPSAWQRLVQRANQFTQTAEDPSEEQEMTT